MNNIQINNQNVAVKEYQGQRVITFKEIDLVHNRPAGTASRNFKANKKHFIEGEDYYLLKRDNPIDEIRPLEIPPLGLTFITESGYLMLVKSFTDNLAWQVQRELVKNYFRIREKQKVILRDLTVDDYKDAAKYVSQCYKDKEVLKLILELLEKGGFDIPKTEVQNKSNSFACKLQSIIDEKGMTQTEIAKLTGLPKSGINYYCRGIHAPRKDKIILIADALEVTIDYFRGVN